MPRARDHVPSLRIIAGAWKGRRLALPSDTTTRPLTDRIKQSLFDWLGQSLDGQRVADVCAGSGSFAFEAASRGASEVFAIESDAGALAVLRANHHLLGAPTTVHLLGQTFQQALPALRDLDLIFADPPFPWFVEHHDTLLALLELSAASLSPHGALLIRGETGGRLPIANGLREAERRSYGRSWVAHLVRA